MFFGFKAARRFRIGLASAWLLLFLHAPAQVIPVVTSTNTLVRVMAANTSSGNFQRYEAPGLRIFQGLKPDIVAIQEFNYAGTNGVNTPAAFREMIDIAFGTNFSYYRETSASETYSIPNGIISRFPILTNGTWDDVLIPDRGYAWARIDLPGSNDLYLVSVHLKSSSGSASTRASEATNLKTLIQTQFSNAWVIVAGDFNIASSDEAALSTFKTFLSDDAVPSDKISLSPTNTNESRSERYDYVLASFSLTNRSAPLMVGSQSFPNGLVFDSEVFSPLSEVSPVLYTDSHVTGMQHMAVMKCFSIAYLVTNNVPRPQVRIDPDLTLRWVGLSNLLYRVEMLTNAAASNWTTVGYVSSSSTNFPFPNQVQGPQQFLRVVYP